ncbi:MAG: hypothetical protein DRN14_00195 [Thermoplasmata archaeon]|nr:MAG: hypothetical protein DRN14_00195 [Thermoplasmata archaeon]
MMRFQIRGVRFLEKNAGRAIIGDDMGVGKTLQALGWLAIHPEARPVVIVCPANGKYNWQEQIEEHTDLDCEVLSGRSTYAISSDIVILNYDIIVNWESELLAMCPQVLIIDESHYVKTRGIKRTKVCKNLAKICPHVMCLSGTPIINRPIEFFPVLNMVRPKQFSSFWKYAMRYCDPKRAWRGQGWDFRGASHTEELHEMVSPFMIRRMKTDVLKELPPKRRIVLPVELSNRREYEQAKKHFLEWYASKKGEKKALKAAKAEGFVKLGQLKRLAAEGKMRAAMEWIDDFLEMTGQKLVVFCHHHVIFDLLKKRYKKIAAVGGAGSKRRADDVRRFQEDDKCRIYIGSIKADGQAITLTAASTTLFVEHGWTPGEHDQAEDRVNRIGQAADKITAYHMIARDTIDEYVWAIIEKKRDVVSQVIDGKSTLRTDVDFDAIIRHLKRRQ